MKKIKIYSACLLLVTCSFNAVAQDSTAKTDQQENILPTKEATKLKPVKFTFEGIFIIDNQTCIVPIKKTLEFDIQHRFGTINNGRKDGFGIFAPANIRLGMVYTPIDNLSVGTGFTKERMTWDINAKYSILKQSVQGGWPVSVSYFGIIGMDTREKKGNFVEGVDRFSYFNQLMVARKITEKFSAQASVSLSHFNNVEGYINSDGAIKPKKNNDHVAIAFLGRYKLTEKTSVIANYDQPLTRHPMNNPHPNISFGMEMSSKGHTFQFFLGNFQSIVQQYNNLNNQNDYKKSNYVIGFNITRNWHFSK